MWIVLKRCTCGLFTFASRQLFQSRAEALGFAVADVDPSAQPMVVPAPLDMLNTLMGVPQW